MSDIIVFNIIITADPIGDKIFVASTDKNSIVFPTLKIENPKFLYNEIRYDIKNLFAKNMIRFFEEIRISFIDIQNYILLNLLENPKYKQIYDTKDNDIIILCGVVLDEKLIGNNTYWIPIKNLITQPVASENIENDVIKYVFDRLII